MRQPLVLFDLRFPEMPRWVAGDQHVRRLVRNMVAPFRGRGPGGLAKVTHNLCLGLEKLGVEYSLRKDVPDSLPGQSVVGVLHGPLEACRRLSRNCPCIVGPGVMNAPSEWPDLFTNSNAIYNVQNCEWAAAIYRPIHGNRVRVWSMGVDHVKYAPDRNDKKAFDFLVYDKVRWPDTEKYRGLVAFCRETLAKAGLSSRYLRYGQYPRGRESAYHDLLRQARAMLYLSENETQGFAYNEALSMDVPILAWNIGLWCDPYRHDSGVGNVPATSIPYWDERCGVDFRNKSDFAARLGLFLERLQAGQFAPREYVLDNLRLEQGAQRYLDLIEAANEELPRQESIRQ